MKCGLSSKFFDHLSMFMTTVDTCAADGPYTILVEREAAADCLFAHMFVELVTASKVQQCTVKLVTRQQSVNRSHHLHRQYTRNLGGHKQLAETRRQRHCDTCKRSRRWSPMKQ